MNGDEMRRLRMNRGYSLRALARELGVPEQSLRRIEGGLGVSLANAKRIADFYGVEVLDILPEPETSAA